MVYMGSKNKYVKYIIPIIQKYINENNINTFIDCFCGSASIADQINCNRIIANDLSPTLIALHKQAQEDFSKIPIDCSREDWDKAYAEWKKIKDDRTYIPNMPLYIIGAIEWYASYNRGGFPKGYARPCNGRNYYDEGIKNHKKQAEKENYKKIEFMCGSYDEILFSLQLDLSSTLLYCDSPYKGTTPYGIDRHFNFDKYYFWLRETSKTIPIFISEQQMPDDFPIVWEKEINRTTNTANKFKACEKLYFIDNR